MTDGAPQDRLAKSFSMDRQIRDENSYVERLQKIVPLEVTSLFIFISKLGTKTEWEGLLGILFIILIVALWPYTTRYQHVTSWIQKVVIILSFILWVAFTDPDLMIRVLESEFDSHPAFNKYLNSTPLGMIAAVWTFLVPLLMPAEQETP